MFVLCLICALSDALLIAAGVAGLGTLVSQSPTLISIVTLGGAIFLAAYSLFAFRRAFHPATLKAGKREDDLKRAVLACLAFTFLNPHVYLDTVVLVGSLSARYDGGGRLAYALGAMLASFVWFFSLGYGARLLAPLFAKPAAWRVLDVVIGLVMGTLAFGLLYRFVQTA